MASSSSSSSSSSIFPTSQWTYDAFLSFSGEDTRNTAADFINYALKHKGIYTFKDDEKLEQGKTIDAQLFKAIKESRFAVVILSENYASSTWCLNELVEIVACEKMGMTILPIFYNVDPSDVRKQKGTFAQRFDEYEKQFEEKVGTWRAALNHVANIVGCHVDNSPLSTAVESIVGKILQESSPEFSEITEDLVGIESRMLELKSYLALWLKDEVRFIGIWAMGGMGKTALAKVAYKMLSKEFEACCFIDDVRENYKQDQLSLQKNLISQILNDKNLNIKNKCEGEHMIKNRLRGKRILLVLDDVDDLKQLQMLAGKRDWFGRGSRIIITTRDKHLLETHIVDKIYEVEALENVDALHLFCSKAFKSKLIPDEYLELSNGFLKYVAGHPLALNVLGSFLFRRSVVEWGNAYEKLKEHPKQDVIQVLKISYDGLDGQEQEIFKDIACFFNHMMEDYVVQILKIHLGRFPYIGLGILIERSLLKFSENHVLWMHDLVQDMGRDMVRHESSEPGERSRLWLYKDIDHVMKNNTGTENVQAMVVTGAENTRIFHEEKEACWIPQGLPPLVTLQGWVLRALSDQGLALLISLWGWVQRTLSWQGFTSSKRPEGLLWNPNAFLKMPNLKFLKIHCISLQLDTLPLPNNLSYFECDGYLLKSLDSLPAGLVELHLPCSRIELLWGGMKIFENLRFINMQCSFDLIISPNLSGVPNLEKLNLSFCVNLRKLHPSVEKLKKLELLNLEWCQALTNLPDKLELESLVTLKLSRCLKVEKIPNTICRSTSLKELDLSETAIKELPSSVKFLIGLTSLRLRDCKIFDKLPVDLWNIVSLKVLDLGGTAIEVLPSSIERLAALQELILQNCKNLVCLPCTICNLTGVLHLNLFGCSKIANLPENLGKMESLKDLHLGGTAIKELPESFSQFFRPTHLYLGGCKSLQSLSYFPANVEFICVDNCTSLERLPELPNDLSLSPVFGYTVQCFNCFKLAENIQDFSNMFQGQTLKYYIVPGCEIPKWFEEVNMYDTFVTYRRWYSNKVKLQLPLVGDNPRGIVWCLLFIRCSHRRFHELRNDVDGCRSSCCTYSEGEVRISLKSEGFGGFSHTYFLSEYVEGPHLWLGKMDIYLPETPGGSIDKNGFHQDELEVETEGMDVEKIGFRLV